eukprot:CAMPEP_0181110468 /NCGR_PEP_ID=MMETSP1071-20121207/18735_1 /TAXON_ID=35127 /ORGANISM="Thalassiosira sp., Strain NH16" /LENGTH=150 /DNA_ID=CAMNT_0023194251 /DNA_START=125 /DNA_END=577 /DNA_ORIENTATION=+
MGAAGSKAEDLEATKRERLEAALGPPSKTMDASKNSQDLVMQVAKTIESHLGLLPVPGKRRSFEATQMITRDLYRNRNDLYNSSNNGDGKRKNDGVMYYIKLRTDVKEWPWVFVKIFEPPLTEGVAVTAWSRATFEGMKKMNEDYKLVTF